MLTAESQQFLEIAAAAGSKTVAIECALKLLDAVRDRDVEITRLRTALHTISDPTSAMKHMGHRPSYGDWELRKIARDALKEGL